MVSSKRIGRFSVDLSLIERPDQSLKTIMGSMIIVSAMANYARRCIDYEAISDLFDEVELGEQIPEYELSVGDSLEIYAMRRDRPWNAR